MKHSTLLLSLPLFFLLLAGCQTSPSQSTSNPAASESASEEASVSEDASSDANTTESDDLSIITSFYPLFFITQSIVGETTEVRDLAANQEVHDFRPTPQDIVALNEASLVIYQGAQLETWAEDLVPQLDQAGIELLEVSSSLTLHGLKEEHSEDEHHDEEEHRHSDEEHDHEDEHDHHHSHGEFDPHTWLDPVLAQEMTDTILEKLISLSPENSELYSQNAQGLKQELQAYDDRYSALSCSGSRAIISHDAFGYPARSYDFDLLPVAGISTNDEPSAQVLAELTDQAEDGITHILTEQGSIQRFAQTLSAETGLIMLPIYTLETNAEEFFSGYEQNFTAFSTAFQCQ